MPVDEMRTEWPDGRLDSLERRVDQAATKTEMGDLRRELRERTESMKRDVGAVGKKIDNLMGDPVAEGRAKRTAIIVGAIGALTGVAGTSVLYLLSGAAPH